MSNPFPDYLHALHHDLEEAGHTVVSPAKSLADLNMDLKRIGQLVEHTAADAWVVVGGTIEVLEWFSTQPKPSFAILGRHIGLPMAGVSFEKKTAFATTTRQLIDHGHRRIVMLARKIQRLPKPGLCAQCFLDELEAHGIPRSTYNLPDWEENGEAFNEILANLFRVTPPTALILDEPFIFFAAKQFLSKRNIRVPEDVSLVCADWDPLFVWSQPPIAHIYADTRPVARCAVRWATAVSKGKQDKRKTVYPAEFIPGGTIGPVPGA